MHDPIRRPIVSDIPDLARIHVQAWRESYAGLLPDAEIAAYTLSKRTAQWTHQITTDTAIAYAPGLGFAQSGPQRCADLSKEYPSELYAIYILDGAKGTGLAQRLFAAVQPQTAFTALCIRSNTRAMRFYEKTGATTGVTRTDRIGETPIEETLMIWAAPD